MRLVAIAIFLAQLAIAMTQPSPVERLQARVQVDSVRVATMGSLAGKYSNPPRVLGPALSGNDIYLFPDGTYIYCEWADIEPLTVYDKGRWRFEGGLLSLSSDSEISWDPGAERQYVVVHRRSRPQELLLIGALSDISRFEEGAKDDPETMLLVIAKERSSKIAGRHTKKIKARLMKESWRPEHFLGAAKH